MPVHRATYQAAHITIVVAYTFFCVSVLGIEDPIPRMLASIGTAIPVLWAVWALAHARLPAQTMDERLREELRHRTAGLRYRKMTDELLALTKEVKALDLIAAEVEAGRLAPATAFRRARTIEHQMKRRIETIGELATTR